MIWFDCAVGCTEHPRDSHIVRVGCRCFCSRPDKLLCVVIGLFVRRKVVLICGWMIFAYVAYKTSQVQIDFTEFDPYAELGIDRVVTYSSLHIISSILNSNSNKSWHTAVTV